MTTSSKGTDELGELTEELKRDAEKVDDIRARAEKKVADEHPGEPKAETKDNGQEYDIFKVIVDSIMKVVQDPAIQRAFSSLKDKFNRLGTDRATSETGDISKELIEVISMAISYSVVMSINYYDYQLKQALGKDFEDISEVITRLESDLSAITMKVSDLEKVMAIMETKLNG